MVETVFVGVILALLYSEFTGIVPGGIIVPAFLALSLDEPYRGLLTLGISLLTLVLYKLAARFLLLFGRRRFVLIILIGACLSELSLILLQGKTMGPSPELRAIGWVIPGLLANNLERQKFWPTLASLITVTIMAYFLGNLLSAAAIFPR